MNKNHWKLVLAYDGTDFHGWQAQPGVPTVQGTLSDAIASVTGERVLPQGSGRTDAGVHALGQVASFALTAPIPAANLQHALNRILPASIRVLAAERVTADFHARHCASGKFYQYRIFQGPICSPLLARYVTPFHWQLDLAAMQQAAEMVLGEHDFTSFAATDPDRATRQGECNADHVALNVRRIEQSHWSRIPLSSCIPGPAIDAWNPLYLPGALQADAESPSHLLTYTVCGNGFLHHMVRNLVGTFLDVGRGRIAPSSIIDILNGQDRSLAGPTAPPQGLFLLRVIYTSKHSSEA